MGSNDLYTPFFYYKEWKDYILFDLAEWQNGFAFKKKDFSDRGIPIIKIAELKNGITGNTNFTNGIFEEKYYLKRKDLLFSWSGSPDTSIDVFWFNMEKGWLNQHIFKLYPKEQIITKEYLYYLLKYLKPNLICIAKNKQTTGLGHVTIEDLKKIKVKLPLLPEQQKIASILSAFDDKIELNNEMNKTLEEIAQAIFKHWFIDFEFPNENGEPYKSSGGEFVDSELGPIPKGWEVERLGDLIKFIKGKKPSDISERKRSNYLLYLTIDVIKGNTILYANPAKTVIANKFDILMVMDGASSGDIYCGVEGIVASTISKLEIVNSHIPEEFVYYLLKDKKIEISKHTTGTAIPHVDKGFVSSIKVAIPKEKEILNDFKNKVRLIRRKIIANNEQNHVLYQLRDTLLPKLISGEIRVM